MIVLPFKHEPRHAIVLGDLLDLRPADNRVKHAFAIETAPSGAKATFTGSQIVPDIAGHWLFAVSAGDEKLRVPVLVFHKDAISALKVSPATLRPYTEQQRSAILRGVAREWPLPELLTWIETNKMPTRLSLARFGA